MLVLGLQLSIVTQHVAFAARALGQPDGDLPACCFKQQRIIPRRQLVDHEQTVLDRQILKAIDGEPIAAQLQER